MSKCRQCNDYSLKLEKQSGRRWKYLAPSPFEFISNLDILPSSTNPTDFMAINRCPKYRCSNYDSVQNKWQKEELDLLISAIPYGRIFSVANDDTDPDILYLFVVPNWIKWYDTITESRIYKMTCKNAKCAKLEVAHVITPFSFNYYGSFKARSVVANGVYHLLVFITDTRTNAIGTHYVFDGNALTEQKMTADNFTSITTHRISQPDYDANGDLGTRTVERKFAEFQSKVAGDGKLFHVESRNILLYFSVSEWHSTWIYPLGGNKWHVKKNNFRELPFLHVIEDSWWRYNPEDIQDCAYILSNDERFVLIFGGSPAKFSQNILIYDIEHHQIAKSGIRCPKKLFYSATSVTADIDSNEKLVSWYFRRICGENCMMLPLEIVYMISNWYGVQYFVHLLGKEFHGKIDLQKLIHC